MRERTLQGVGGLAGIPGIASGHVPPHKAYPAGGAATVVPYHQAWSRPLDAAGRVEVWLVPAGAHRRLAQQARILGREDWSAIAKLRDENARNHLRAARITLRLALSHAVGNSVKPAAWRFDSTSYGKPRVAEPKVNFCISHIETMS